MELTRRGYGVVGIVLAAEAFALAFGARSLNAIAGPGLIALAGAALQVHLHDDPSVQRGPLRSGFVGDYRELELGIEGSAVAAVRQPVPDGIKTTPGAHHLSLPGQVTIPLELADRGAYELGPAAIEIRDLLGLVSETHESGGQVELYVYPPVYHLAGREAFIQNVLETREVERQEFDSLREYTPGDPLRDVHWKSSAKDPETLYVKDFIDRRVETDVVIAAECVEGMADEMATATASVVVMAMDLDLGVELHVGGLTVPTGRGKSHRTRLLEVLAEFNAGSIPGDGPEDPDIYIFAGPDGVEITLGTWTRSLYDLTVSRDNPLTSEGMAT